MSNSHPLIRSFCRKISIKIFPIYYNEKCFHFNIKWLRNQVPECDAMHTSRLTSQKPARWLQPICIKRIRKNKENWGRDKIFTFHSYLMQTATEKKKTTWHKQVLQQCYSFHFLACYIFFWNNLIFQKTTGNWLHKKIQKEIYDKTNISPVKETLLPTNINLVVYFWRFWIYCWMWYIQPIWFHYIYIPT
jgi:hypothetical protein